MTNLALGCRSESVATLCENLHEILCEATAQSWFPWQSAAGCSQAPWLPLQASLVSGHVLANASEHVVPSQKHDVAVEIFADVRIGLHDSLDVVSWIPLASLPSSGAALLVMPMPASSMVMVELARRE